MQTQNLLYQIFFGVILSCQPHILIFVHDILIMLKLELLTLEKQARASYSIQMNISHHVTAIYSFICAKWNGCLVLLQGSGRHKQDFCSFFFFVRER